MSRITSLTLAILVATVGSASAGVNICQAGKLTCATTMPVGGFCECTSHGTTQDGTVVAKPAPKRKVNSTSGGCGSQPNAPGCR
jgi:hypothetical protein